MKATLLIVLGIYGAAGMKTPDHSSLVQKTGLHTDTIVDSEHLEHEVQTSLGSMVTRLLEIDSKAPKLHDVIKVAGDKVDMKKVATRLEEKVPADVMSLVNNAAHEKKGKGPFSEASLTKAREVLNDMVEASQVELDTKIIDCQTFKNANRATMDQITTDLARLGEQIADTERLKLEANNGIVNTNQIIVSTKADLEKERSAMMQEKATDDADMRIKQNDLDVFQFILEFTACQESAAALLQKGKKKGKLNVCEKNGELVLNFGTKEAQEKYERKLTASSQKAIRKILMDVRTEEASFVQAGNTTTYAPVQSATVPVAEGAGDSGELKCPPTPPDCGLLNDKMSLMWGTYKDQVDELQHQMDQKAAAWDELHANFLTQIKILTNTLNTYSGQLSEATANLNADHEEQRSKLSQKLQVEAEYEDYMGKCKARIEWILFQDICAIVVVRNAVLVDSTVCPTAEIIDCAVEDWIPGTCSVSCDDSCPHPNDPFQCGGWRTLTRRIVAAPTSCGLKCPTLTYQQKCNQIKCPVDCVMSEWSDYSKCTKDCEGGVQQRTRNVVTNSRNGGEWCENPTEQRACNTGSCDRDCVISDWTEWTPCSMACKPNHGEPGVSKRQRDVVVPTRGEGMCPTAESDMRLEYKECNTHACTGDEECYAVQDLIIAIDGSGSITLENFETLRDYVVRLVARYKGEVYNMELMKVGIVQFGNGEIMEDGTVSNALKILPLTSDMEAVTDSVSSLTFRKGFTNMAQAFSLAEAMYSEGGRENAQSAIMVITDGKPSFTWQTQQKVKELEDKGIQRYFVTIADNEGAETELMKQWASAPWYSNHIHIPGFVNLMSTNQTYVQENVVMFCPNSQSPQVCHATAYQHASFLGWAADFPEGAYDMARMQARGASNDDMSSLKVFGGNCVATVYEHADFSGWVFDYPEGWYDFRAFLAQGARNDQVSSIFVWKNEYGDEGLE